MDDAGGKIPAESAEQAQQEEPSPRGSATPVALGANFGRSVWLANSTLPLGAFALMSCASPQPFEHILLTVIGLLLSIPKL